MNHSPPTRILVVDDDVDLLDLVTGYLRKNGFEAEGVTDAEAFRASCAKREPDLVVLDLMLPGEDGLSVLRGVRANDGPPVIIASARVDEVDRVVGLEVGADDYLPKPYGPRELLARIRAVLRRTGARAEAHAAEWFAFGRFRLHFASHRLTGPEGDVPLTSAEFALLRAFAEHPDQVLTRDRLLTLTKGYERSPFDRSIDVGVTRLRRKIEPDPERPVFLRTVWGEGYVFSPSGGAAP